MLGAKPAELSVEAWVTMVVLAFLQVGGRLLARARVVAACVCVCLCMVARSVACAEGEVLGRVVCVVRCAWVEQKLHASARDRWMLSEKKAAKWLRKNASPSWEGLMGAAAALF